MKNKIKERRRELGMSQNDLAATAEIGRSTLSEIETGKHEPPVGVAIRIAQALNATVEKLFLLN